MVRFALPFSLLTVAAAESVRPVAKVITLLTELKTEIETEGTAEAGTYDTFACFCRTTTSTKSTAVTSGRDTIHTLSSEIEAKTATKLSKSTDLAKRQKEQEASAAELQETQEQLTQATNEYETKNADLEKAISSLDNAIQAMESSKPALLSVRQTLKRNVELAEALNLITESNRKEVHAFLQSGQIADPTGLDGASYRYHSQHILDLLKKLRTEFGQEKTTADTEWGKTKTSLSGFITGVTGVMSSNTAAMGGLSTGLDTLRSEIATARESLVNAHATLKGDQLYLQDLTTRCESRAKDWDQRSQLRSDELTALTSALQVLTDDVQGRDTAVNNRTLFLERPSIPVAPKLRVAAKAKISAHSASPSFLQEASAHGLLRGVGAARRAKAQQDKASALLRQASTKFRSATLSTVAAHVAADPFAKVKTLIQGLIERLLKESTMEATKKGFCDEQLGKNYKDRDYRLEETQTLLFELKALNLKEDELGTEIQLLTQALSDLRTNLDTATTARDTERTENNDAIKTAKEGVEAVKEAITIMKVFYSKAGRAVVLAQASPVDENTTGPGFSGAYRGKQQQSHGIISLLEVILSDFDRTSRMTQAGENKAHAEYVEFDRSSKADISGKEKQKTLDEEDLETTRSTISRKMDDLQTAQSLLDAALKAVIALKPTCIDTGMTYDQRDQQRTNEIAALERALCILDPDQVEDVCQT